MSNVLTETVFGDQLNELMTLGDAIKMLLDQGLIHTGQLTELAISKKTNVALCDPCTPNIDLISGVQIKYATVTRPASSDYYGATVSRNTTAPICLVITNPMENNKQYFMYIPYSAHCHLTGNTISVPFGKDGTGSKSQWWHYQVKDFNKLCELAK